MHRAYLSVAALSSVLAFAPYAAKANEGATGGTPPAPPAPATAGISVTEVSTAFALPVKSGRGGGPSPYKFDDLAAPTVDEAGKQVLASFGVVGKTKKNMNSTVHSANKKHRTLLFNADGSKQMVTRTVKGNSVLEQAFTQDRKFEAFDVAEKDGVTVRIFRIK